MEKWGAARLYSSANIIGVMMIRAGRVARETWHWPLRRHRRSSEDNIKTDLKGITWKGSVQVQVAGFCEHGNKSSVGDAVNFLTNWKAISFWSRTPIYVVKLYKYQAWNTPTCSLSYKVKLTKMTFFLAHTVKQWRPAGTHSLRRHYMEVRGQLQAPAAIPTGTAPDTHSTGGWGSPGAQIKFRLLCINVPHTYRSVVAVQPTGKARRRKWLRCRYLKNK